MRIFYILYVLLTGAVILRALANGAGLISYFDGTSLALILIPSFFVFLINRNENNVFKMMVKTSLIAANLGLSFGLFLTFSNYQDIESFFVGVAVSMLPVLYALIFILLIYPFCSLRK